MSLPTFNRIALFVGAQALGQVIISEDDLGALTLDGGRSHALIKVQTYALTSEPDEDNCVRLRTDDVMYIRPATIDIMTVIETYFGEVI